VAEGSVFDAHQWRGKHVERVLVARASSRVDYALFLKG